MNGCVFKRKLPSGRITWGYSLDLGKNAAGKRLQEFKSGFERKSQAESALRQRLNDKDAGAMVQPDPTSFCAFMDRWFSEHADRQCTPKTVERYRQLLAYVTPSIGTVPIQDLTPLMLESLFNRLKGSGGRDRKAKTSRPLSAKTVHHIAGLVHVALSTALRWKLLKSNPMDGVQLPKLSKKKRTHALEADQLAWYLDAARAHGLYEVVMLAAATGCRRGELLALRWSDVNLITRSVSVCKSLEQTRAGLRVKSTKSEEPRLISLPRSCVPLLEGLQERQTENRRLFGPDYRADLDLVLCGPNGDYLKPDSVTAKACLIAKQVGLKDTSLHTLRHSHGSQLLSAGVPLTAVSKRLGHSSVYVTATVYSHALSKDEQAAGDIWDTKIQKDLEQANPRRVS